MAIVSLALQCRAPLSTQSLLTVGSRKYSVHVTLRGITFISSFVKVGQPVWFKRTTVGTYTGTHMAISDYFHAADLQVTCDSRTSVTDRR